jgi:hypothetical protein
MTSALSSSALAPPALADWNYPIGRANLGISVRKRETAVRGAERR